MKDQRQRWLIWPVLLTLIACSAATPEAQLRAYNKLLDRLNRTCKEPRAQLADRAMAYAQNYQRDYGVPVTALDIVRSTAAAIMVEPICRRAS